MLASEIAIITENSLFILQHKWFKSEFLWKKLKRWKGVFFPWTQSSDLCWSWMWRIVPGQISSPWENWTIEHFQTNPRWTRDPSQDTAHLGCPWEQALGCSSCLDKLPQKNNGTNLIFKHQETTISQEVIFASRPQPAKHTYVTVGASVASRTNAAVPSRNGVVQNTPLWCTLQLLHKWTTCKKWENFVKTKNLENLIRPHAECTRTLQNSERQIALFSLSKFKI